jgi:hypothetical protein
MATSNCNDLSYSFITPETIINPSGIIITNSALRLEPLPSPSSSPSVIPSTSFTPSPSPSNTSYPSVIISPSPSPSPSSAFPSDTLSPASFPSSSPSVTVSPSPSVTVSPSPSVTVSPSTSVSLPSITESPVRSSQSNTPQTVPYVSSPLNMPSSYNESSNYNIQPANSQDYSSFASNEYISMQPNINLVDSKGPNNFFIPNIWIEEYK